MRIITFSLLVFSIIFICGYNDTQGEELQERPDPYLWDFGRVSQGDILNHTFRLENDSADILRIQWIRTSCGCTTSGVEKREIPPGDSIEIPVAFYTQDYCGLTKRYVYIRTAWDKPSIKLTLMADIQGLPSVYFWDFGLVSQGDILNHTFRLENDSSDMLRIKDIHTSCGCTTSTVEKREIPPGDSVGIPVRFNTRGYTGIVKHSICVHTDQQDRPTIELTIKADIQAKGRPR